MGSESSANGSVGGKPLQSIFCSTNMCRASVTKSLSRAVLTNCAKMLFSCQVVWIKRAGSFFCLDEDNCDERFFFSHFKSNDCESFPNFLFFGEHWQWFRSSSQFFLLHQDLHDCRCIGRAWIGRQATARSSASRSPREQQNRSHRTRVCFFAIRARN